MLGVNNTLTVGSITGTNMLKLTPVKFLHNVRGSASSEKKLAVATRTRFLACFALRILSFGISNAAIVIVLKISGHPKKVKPNTTKIGVVSVACSFYARLAETLVQTFSPINISANIAHNNALDTLNNALEISPVVLAISGYGTNELSLVRKSSSLNKKV